MGTIVIFLAIFLTVCNAAAQPSPAEGRVIAECLERFGGLSLENAERLQRYKQWSDTYEEIPCFTNCYLNRMFEYYNETQGFNEENVIKQFGRPLFEACKHRMIQGRDNCELAYNGFHCLVSLENDPFVLIESMERLSSEAKTAMRDCLRKFDQYEWERLSDYTKFPIREPIPCFTKCVIDRLQLYNVRTKQWQMEAMHRKLGVPAPRADVRGCHSVSRDRSRNVCSWMYREFTCFVMAKE